MDRFYLPTAMQSEIVEHAKTGYPEEVCGIIAAERTLAVALYRGRNVSPTPLVAYELDFDTLARQIEFEAEGRTLGAIYHSHPSGPQTLSETDISKATYPDSIYVVCSLAGWHEPSLRGFRIFAGQPVEVRLVGSIPAPAD
jgi:proteasome lid subunit RPN8/RPN11